MEDYETVQEMVKAMENELYALKTRKNIAGLISSYVYPITSAEVQTLTITYASGSQPIISDIYGSGASALSMATLGTVSDNTQKLFITTADSVEIILVSTRPIESVA